jgi:hypothetical protein
MYLKPPLDSSNVTSVDDESEHSALMHDCVQPPLPEHQVNAVLAAPEGPTLEFKRVSGKMVSKATRAVAPRARHWGERCSRPPTDSACES